MGEQEEIVEIESAEKSESRTIQVQHTSPIWRIVSVAAFFVAIGALGFYMREVGHADDFATVAVITLAFSISFWAHKRPDRLQARFGPFGKIANAVRESLDDIRAWVYDRPLRAGVAIAFTYGCLVVLAKYFVILLLGALYSWVLIVVFGALVLAFVAAPEMVSSVNRKLKVSDSEQAPVPEVAETTEG